MASIIESIENVIHDKYSFVKLIIYSIPVLISYNFFRIGNISMFYLVSLLTLIMFMTIIIKVFRNIRTNNNSVLPDFNIFLFIKTATKLFFAMGPIMLICIWTGIKLTQIQVPIPLPNIQIIYSVIVWLITSGIIITSLILYARNEQIKEAYNLKSISDNCISIIFSLLMFLFQIGIFNALSVGSVAYILYVFKFPLDNFALTIVSALSLVTSIAVAGDYFAQIDYEATFDKNN